MLLIQDHQLAKSVTAKLCIKNLKNKKKRAENSAFNHFLTLSSNLSTVMLANLGAKFDPRILVQVEKSARVTRENFHGKWHFFWARLISYLPCKTSRRCYERSRRYSWWTQSSDTSWGRLSKHCSLWILCTTSTVVPDLFCLINNSIIIEPVNKCTLWLLNLSSHANHAW